MYKKFNYLYQNSSGVPEIKKEGLFDGEKIMYKAESIKLEDE